MEDWREPTEAEAETILRKVKKRIKSNRINLGLLSVVIGFYIGVILVSYKLVSGDYQFRSRLLMDYSPLWILIAIVVIAINAAYFICSAKTLQCYIDRKFIVAGGKCIDKKIQVYSRRRPDCTLVVRLEDGSATVTPVTIEIFDQAKFGTSVLIVSCENERVWVYLI
jgi:hypothetical protein